MCGIIGYTGKRQAARILIDGLAKLEYRGYDSAGIAVSGGENVNIVKSKGRLSALSDKMSGGREPIGTCGIGHTRWATHGEPSDANAHPHFSDGMNVTLVHNGIVENYKEIKEMLMREGCSFYSQTDTETAAKLIDFCYKRGGSDPLSAITNAMRKMRGAYALAVMFRDHPDEVWGIRNECPLIAAKGDGESFIASDASAVIQSTRDVYYMESMEIVSIKGDSIEFFNADGQPIKKEISRITWDAATIEKGGFEHFMMKEIHEQGRAVRDTINSAVRDGEIDLSSAGLSEDVIRGLKQIYIVACGSAYHAGVVAQYITEDLAGIPVRMELASEFRYRRLPLEKDGLVIIISQSGETADSLAALRKAKENGLRTLAIVNVLGSTIAREADSVFYTVAGPEIAVATTKAYSAQLAACYIIAIHIAYVRGNLSDAERGAMTEELNRLPEKIDAILDEKERLRSVAEKFKDMTSAFFLGRGIDYALAMEGSLKMKEISYVHSEACAAGEMKHGPISLIDKGTLVIGVITQPDLCEKTASNMLEMRSRGGVLLNVAHRGFDMLNDEAEHTFRIPDTDPHFAASLAVVPLQLLGYYLACARGLDVDKPRNLAKSVTVE